MSGEGEKFVGALDVGTTTVRCLIIDQNGVVRGEDKLNIILEFPKPGWVEIDPEVLWDQIVRVIRGAVKSAGIAPSSISCMSISTQRCSFLCWDVNNNEPLHKIITWKDIRACNMVKDWNHSFYVKAFRFACKLLYGVTQNRRYLSGSVLKFMNEQVIVRLAWVLDNVPGIREKIEQNQVRFGTLDTFIINKFTDGEVHVTDYSCASPTAFFDPFLQNWATWALKMFSIPPNILPEIVPTVGKHFGTCRLFPGVNIPILCSIADQSSSVFGSGLFTAGSVKITLGTGAFLDVNTGKVPHSSVAGIYPLVGWKFGSDLVFLAEGNSKDAGTIVEWGKTIGLYKDVSETSNLAKSVRDTNGCYFIPAFGGLQAPYNDPQASSGFIGINSTTKRGHMVRALLESIAFRVNQLLNVLQSETDFQFDFIRADGGVSQNDFVLQMIANLTRKRVERSTSTEATALGCAFMAGIHAGIWASRDQVGSLYKISKKFLPQQEAEETSMKSFLEWERAVERFLKWSKDT